MSTTPVPGEAGGQHETASSPWSELAARAEAGPAGRPEAGPAGRAEAGPAGRAEAGRAEPAGPSETAPPRRDLAAMIVPLARALVAAEEPVLRAHEVSMWGYVVLTALAEQSVRTQAALAQGIGADKTRIIGVLDELQQRGLIERRPDPADRRVHLLSLTDGGRRLRESVRDAIQGQEEERVLSLLPAADRAAFIRALQVLSELPSEHLRD